MGSCIDHTVFIIVVRQIFTVISCIKSKLQDLHSRVTCLLHQTDHAGGQESEILRDDLLFAQFLLHHSKQFIARSLLPVTVLCRRISVRHEPVLVESPEMVDTEHIV